MLKAHRFTAFLAAVSFIPSTNADSRDTEKTLEPVVVTATRTEQPLDDSLASVSVITAADIERLQARNLMDVLSGRAGINIANSGGEGKLTTLFMRGTSSDHVLILINGMRFGSTTAGIAALQDIPVSQVERIEVVRGPRASLYGSDAIGGVIQVFTRQPESGLQGSVDVTVGSYGRREAAAGIGERFESTWYQLSASRISLDGFDACENDVTSGCFADEPDDDGYENDSISGRVGFAVNDSEISLDAWRASGENFYDGFFSRTDYDQGAYNLHARTAITEEWMLKFRGGRSTDNTENFGPSGSSYTDTQRNEYTVQSDVAFEDALLSFGTDFRRDAVDSSTAYDETRRDTSAGFLQLQLDRQAWSGEVAARYTDDDQFGAETTGSIAFGYEFSEAWQFWLSHGTAYHAPTFNDLYYPGFSNPDLRPEKSRASEIGVRFSGSHRVDINLYENRLDDLIEFDFTTMMPVNVSAARIRGLEIAWQARFDVWTVSAEATLLDTENRSGTNDGNALPRRAERTLRVDVDRVFGEWSLGGGLLAESRRFDDLANTTVLPGYASVDIRASWYVNESWELAARIGNLLDRDYQTVAGYHQPGRNAQLTLRYRY